MAQPRDVNTNYPTQSIVDVRLLGPIAGEVMVFIEGSGVAPDGAAVSLEALVRERINNDRVALAQNLRALADQLDPRTKPVLVTKLENGAGERNRRVFDMDRRQFDDRRAPQNRRMLVFGARHQ